MYFTYVGCSEGATAVREWTRKRSFSWEKKTDKRQVRGNKSLFEIKKYGQELSRKVAIPLNAILVHLVFPSLLSRRTNISPAISG